MNSHARDLRAIVGRAARDLRDRLNARDIVWQEVEGTGLRLLGGNWFAAGANHEGHEVALFREALDDCDAVIDVGANSGLFSLLAAHAGKACFAFEPGYRNLPILAENLTANGLDRQVEVFPVALSDSVGMVPFYGRGQGASLVPGWAGQPTYDFEMVPSNTLDNLLAARLDGQRTLIKLDVEGAELAVLRGAGRILDRCRFLLVEHSLTRNHPGGTNPAFRKLFELLWEAGFHARVAEPEGAEVTEQKVDGWIAAGKHDLRTENFVFSRS